MSDLQDKGHMELLDKLRQATDWSEETLQGHLRQWRSDRDVLLKSISGERIHFDDLGDLVWKSFPENQELERISLYDEVKPNRIGPRAITLLGPDGKQHSRLTIPADCRPGLILNQDRCLLHAPELEKQPLLASSPVWIDAAPQDFRTQHADFYVHFESGLLLACCREAGEIVVISLEDRSELTRWKVRNPGSWHALNVAFDAGGEKAYITDNVTPTMLIADLDSLEFKIWKSGLGILGNLAPGLEPGKIFLSILAPQFSLVYFDMGTMQASYSIETKGKSWAHAKLLPQDPFTIAPDGKLLHFMTWAELEGQRTPVVNVIDAEEIIGQKRFSLKESQQSVLLAYGTDNPFPAWHQLDFETWLVKKQLIAKDTLAKPPAPTSDTPRRKPVARGRFNIYQPPADDKDLWDKIGQQAEDLELPVGAEDAIVDLLNWAFYKMTLTNLRIHPDEMKRLKLLAKKLRGELKDKEVVLAKLENVLGRHSFETPISRRAVTSLMSQAKLSGEMVRLEDACPICQNPFENGVCLACGFQLAWPPEQGYQGLVSNEPGSALYPGQLLLPHKRLNQLLTLNIWRQPLQQLDLTPAGVQQLAYASVLPNHNYLVCDSKGNRMIEVSPGGEAVWKAKLALKNPSMVSWYLADKDLRLLVVDTGNARVLELDVSGRNWRRYPTLKTSEADKLKAPRDMQLTPGDTWLISDPGLQAVLETDVRGSVIRRWGQPEGVSNPLLARRMPDGATEILDAEGRWLSFDAEGQPAASMSFWPPEDNHWKDAPAPDWACQLHNGEYLLAGEKCLMLFAPRSESVRWIHPIPDPKREDALLKVGFKSRSQEETKKAQIEELTAQLKTIGCFEGEKEEHLQALAKHVQPNKASAGNWLLQPGTPGGAMYFVLEGALELIAPEDEKPVIMTLEKGDVCMQQTAFAMDDKAYMPGLRCKEDAKLLQLERGEFKKAVVGFPRLYQIIKSQDGENQRKFKIFAERKTEAVQDQLRHSINQTRIREFGLFTDANDQFFEALADKVQPLAYMPEQDVFGRGESAGSLYLIMQGQVGVLRKGESEPMIVLGEGEIFGEMALYSQQPRTATIRTLDYCKFFEIEYRHVRTLSARFPWFGLRLEEMARQRQQSNEIALEAFEESAGLKRDDLPVVEVAPAGLKLGQKLFYQASLHHDALTGFNTQGEVLWFWGREPERQLFQPTRVHQLEDAVLVVEGGNDRVLLIDLPSRELRRKWSVGLNQPAAAALTPEGLLLAADTGNQRLVVMDDSGREVWVHGVPEEIMKPTWVEFTPDGNILFADAGMHRVYELQRDGILVWKHGKWRNPGSANDQLDSPSCVRRLADGGTLIADAGNQRLVWVRPEADPLLIPLDSLNLEPDYCDMLENGEFLVGSSQADTLVRINRRGELIWRAQLRFPTATAVISETRAEGEQWILDLDRIDQLELPAAAEPAAQVSEPAEAVPDTTDLVMAWGEGAPEPEAYVPEPEAPTAMSRELDALLGDLHETIAAEVAPEVPPASPEDVAAAMDKLFEDDFGSAPSSSTPSHTLMATTDDELADALDQLFDDEDFGGFAQPAAQSQLQDPTGSTQFVPDKPMMTEFVAEGPMPTMPASALPWAELGLEEPASPPPAPLPPVAASDADEDLASALDQLFDDEESFRGTGPLPAMPATPLPAGPSPTQMHNQTSHPTQMVNSLGHPTKMVSDQPHPTKIVSDQPMHTIPAPSLPWAELGLDEPAGGPAAAALESRSQTGPLPEIDPSAPASGWNESDFDFLEQLDDYSAVSSSKTAPLDEQKN